MRTSMKRMGSFTATILMTALASTLPGCGDDPPADAVYTRARPDADFDSYETFAIATKDEIPNLPDPPGDLPNDLPEDIEEGLRTTENAVREQLTMRGLDEVDVDDDPDLYVLDFAASDDMEGIYWECVPGWTWWGWYTYWDPCAWLQPVPVEYTVGSILVLVSDPNIEPDDDYGHFVFGGLGQGLLNGGDNEGRINAAVARMFADWPK